MNENQLVEKASLGDNAAFEELFKLYETKIYNLTLRWLGDPQDALDATQEVFLKVYRYLPNLKNQSIFGTWIYKIAINVCRDIQSKRTANVLSIDEDGEFEVQIADIRYSPENEFERRQIKEIIKEGIMSLEEGQKAAIIMRDINGMSYEDIASILDINSGTVKSRIARAREKLRKKLCESGNFSEKDKSKYSEKEERL